MWTSSSRSCWTSPGTPSSSTCTSSRALRRWRRWPSSRPGWRPQASPTPPRPRGWSRRTGRTAGASTTTRWMWASASPSCRPGRPTTPTASSSSSTRALLSAPAAMRPPTSASRCWTSGSRAASGYWTSAPAAASSPSRPSSWAQPWLRAWTSTPWPSAPPARTPPSTAWPIS